MVYWHETTFLNSSNDAHSVRLHPMCASAARKHLCGDAEHVNKTGTELQGLYAVRVLKQSQSALFSSISNMTILFVFTRVMNI